MKDEKIGSVEAAQILGVQSYRAALAIIKDAGITVEYRMEYDRFRKAEVSRLAVQALADDRRSRGVKRGRRSKNVVVS
jgi:hypothetical protein